MARSRNIKPAFFDNEDLAEMPAINRLLFIGLWCLADREGRVEFRPKRIKAQIFPYDNCDVSEMLTSLSGYDFIKIYSVDSKAYIQINKWAKHQNPHHKEIASILPQPENHKDTVCDGYIPMSNTIRNRIYKDQGRVCICCKRTEALEIDHKLPISKGGNSVDENLQVLCKRCNVKKFNNYIDFSLLGVDDLSMIQAWFMHGSSITQEQFKKIESCHTDSLSLIPDSPILNPEPLSKELLSGKPDSIIVLQYLNDSLDTKYKITTKSHIENINARLGEGHSVEDLKRVVDAKKLEWGNDPAMAQYLRPQTLFGNKFQGYLIAANTPAKQVPAKSIHSFEKQVYKSGLI